MTREMIYSLMQDTPLWLWPVLFWSIRRVQAFLDGLSDEDYLDTLYEVQVTRWGTLKLVPIFHNIKHDPEAWKAPEKLKADWLSTDLLVAPYLHLFRSSQRTLGSSDTETGLIISGSRIISGMSAVMSCGDTGHLIAKLDPG